MQQNEAVLFLMSTTIGSDRTIGHVLARYAAD